MADPKNTDPSSPQPMSLTKKHICDSTKGQKRNHEVGDIQIVGSVALPISGRFLLRQRLLPAVGVLVKKVEKKSQMILPTQNKKVCLDGNNSKELSLLNSNVAVKKEPTLDLSKNKNDVCTSNKSNLNVIPNEIVMRLKTEPKDSSSETVSTQKQSDTKLVSSFTPSLISSAVTRIKKEPEYSLSESPNIVNNVTTDGNMESESMNNKYNSESVRNELAARIKNEPEDLDPKSGSTQNNSESNQMAYSSNMHNKSNQNTVSEVITRIKKEPEYSAAKTDSIKSSSVLLPDLLSIHNKSNSNSVSEETINVIKKEPVESLSDPKNIVNESQIKSGRASSELFDREMHLDLKEKQVPVVNAQLNRKETNNVGTRNIKVEPIDNNVSISNLEQNFKSIKSSNSVSEETIKVIKKEAVESLSDPKNIVNESLSKSGRASPELFDREMHLDLKEKQVPVVNAQLNRKETNNDGTSNIKVEPIDNNVNISNLEQNVRSIISEPSDVNLNNLSSREKNKIPNPSKGANALRERVSMYKSKTLIKQEPTEFNEMEESANNLSCNTVENNKDATGLCHIKSDVSKVGEENSENELMTHEKQSTFPSQKLLLVSENCSSEHLDSAEMKEKTLNTSKNLFNEMVQIGLFGSSHVKKFPQYIMEHTGARVTKITAPSDQKVMVDLLKNKIRMEQLLNEIKPRQYDAIIIMVGGNDICNHDRHDVVVGLLDLHKQLSTRAPKVFIAQIFNRDGPSGQYAANYKTNLNFVNRKLKTKLKDLDYRPVISLPKLELREDGMHLTLDGYKVLTYFTLVRLRAELQVGGEITLPTDWDIPYCYPRLLGKSQGHKGYLYRKRKMIKKYSLSKYSPVA